jgi:hypothetical protein
MNKNSKRIVTILLSCIFLGLISQIHAAFSWEDNIVAHYKMNDNAASTTVVDAQGYSDGTAQQNTSDLSAAGKINDALIFTPQTDYIDCNNSFTSTFQSDFSISLWFYSYEDPIGSDRIFGGAGYYTLDPFFLYSHILFAITKKYFPTRHEMFMRYTVNNQEVIAESDTVDAISGWEWNAWHHAVTTVTQDGTNVTVNIYLDNALVATNTAACTMADYTTIYEQFFIGEKAQNGEPWDINDKWDGLLDSVMLFNKALSLAEIAELYNSGNGIEDFTPPTNVEISSIIPDSTSQLTITATATDPESGLHATPYQFQETSENPGGSSSGCQASPFTDTELSANTRYTYEVRARDYNNNQSGYSSTFSRYTLAPTPTNFFTSYITTNSIIMTIDSFPNDTSDQSGYYFSRSGNNSGWIHTNSWIDTGFLPGTTYVYSVKYRNGDGIETDFIFPITEEGGQRGEYHCFIATACYGTPMAEEVMSLRTFRDTYLLTNPIGEGFVNSYYKISPSIANFIREHPILKNIVRTILKPLIWISEKSVDLKSLN